MNPSDPRQKREPPEREGPIRNRLTTPPKTNGAATPEGRQSAPRPDKIAGEALREALECGVRTAYTVIDEYLRRGYDAARSNRDHPDNRGQMHSNRTSQNSWTNPWGPMALPMQQWMTVMRAWADAWSAFVPGGWPQQMWNMASPECAPAAAGPVISVQVSSQRPTEVTATLNPGAEFCLLTVDSLKAEASKPALPGISISSAPGSVRIGVPVSEDQPAGKYSGDIKADGKTVGNLSVVITDLAGKPA